MNIVIISGSPRTQGMTVRIALNLRDALKTQHNVELIDMKESALPPIQSVFTKEDNTPDEYKAVRAKMFAADAFIFVSPEYNGGYSSVMKNFLDHFPKAAYMRKTIGIATGSDGMFGGMRAALQLQLLSCALFGVPCPRMLVTPQADRKFDTSGKLVDGSFQKSIDDFLAEFLWQAESLSKSKS